MYMEQGNRILVVEDDASLRRALKEKLSRENFEVLEASDGEEGIEVAIREHPDLILLDIVMPRLDGLSALSRLRTDPWGKTARVVMLTNVHDGESVRRSLDEAAFDYLVKSDWRLEDVVKKIRERISRHSGRVDA